MKKELFEDRVILSDHRAKKGYRPHLTHDLEQAVDTRLPTVIFYLPIPWKEGGGTLRWEKEGV